MLQNGKNNLVLRQVALAMMQQQQQQQTNVQAGGEATAALLATTPTRTTPLTQYATANSTQFLPTTGLVCEMNMFWKKFSLTLLFCVRFIYRRPIRRFSWPPTRTAPLIYCKWLPHPMATTTTTTMLIICSSSQTFMPTIRSPAIFYIRYPPLLPRPSHLLFRIKIVFWRLSNEPTVYRYLRLVLNFFLFFVVVSDFFSLGLFSSFFDF